MVKHFDSFVKVYVFKLHNFKRYYILFAPTWLLQRDEAVELIYSMYDYLIILYEVSVRIINH